MPTIRDVSPPCDGAKMMDDQIPPFPSGGRGRGPLRDGQWAESGRRGGVGGGGTDMEKV